MIDKVVFFNSWHFGDLHSNKEYVRQFSEEFKKHNIYVVYATMAAPRAVNLPIDCVSIYEYVENNLPGNPLTWHDPVTRTMYINTWIGYYLTMERHNFASQKVMWEDLATQVLIASDGLINIKINEDPSFYISDIDEDLFEKPQVPAGKNVLICNDIPISGQSHNGDWSKMINQLALEFPNINFICTNVVSTELDNVYFTNVLTNRAAIGCDLPEVGYIAGFCNMIITNSSGPGTFSMTKNVLLSNDKVVIAFVQSEGNAQWSGINVFADVSWHPVWDDETVSGIIREKILESLND